MADESQWGLEDSEIEAVQFQGTWRSCDKRRTPSTYAFCRLWE